jgi:hypothetical protein
MATTEPRNPQPGDFGLLAGTDKVGRLIEVAEMLNGDGFSTYSHAMIYLGGGEVFEAEPGGARIALASEYSDPIVWSDWALTDTQRGAICARCTNLPPTGYLGIGYSAMDYFALAAKRFRLPIPWLRSYVESSGHMICSQLVDAIYAGAGLPMFSDGRWPGYVTPQDLAAALHGPVAA